MLPGLPDTHVLYYNKCNPSYSPQKSMLLSLDSRFLWSSFYEKQTQTSQRSAGPARWIWEFIGHHPPKKLPQRSPNDVCLLQSSNEIYCQTICKTILNTIFDSTERMWLVQKATPVPKTNTFPPLPRPLGASFRPLGPQLQPVWAELFGGIHGLAVSSTGWWSNWIISPGIPGEIKKYLKPPPLS